MLRMTPIAEKEPEPEDFNHEGEILVYNQCRKTWFLLDWQNNGDDEYFFTHWVKLEPPD